MNSEAALQRFDLTGKVSWLIGGGGKRLGGTVSRALAEHGATLLICAIDEYAARETAELINRGGGNAEPYVLDVANESQIIQCAEHIRSRYGQLDIMINMAARSTSRYEAMDKTLDDWSGGIDVTLTGAFLTSREAGRLMRDSGGGSIVQFSSIYGVVSPQPAVYSEATPINPVDYGVAKAGVLQLVRYQAVTMARHRVRVNAVVPGPFPGEPGELDPVFQAKLAERIPLGRVGRMEEIAGAVILLCSDAGAFITGSQIVVDGGWTAQ